MSEDRCAIKKMKWSLIWNSEKRTFKIKKVIFVYINVQYTNINKACVLLAWKRSISIISKEYFNQYSFKIKKTLLITIRIFCLLLDWIFRAPFLGRVKLPGQLNYSQSVKCREEKTFVIEHEVTGAVVATGIDGVWSETISVRRR